MLQVKSVSRDPAGEQTAIEWARSEPDGAIAGDIDNPEIFWLRQEHPLLGYNLALVGKDDIHSRLASIAEAVSGDRAEDAWNHARALAELSAGRFPSLQDPMSALLVAIHGFFQDSQSSDKKQQAADAVAAMASRQDAFSELPHFRVHEGRDASSGDKSGDKSIDLAVETRDLFPDTWLVLIDIGKDTAHRRCARPPRSSPRPSKSASACCPAPPVSTWTSPSSPTAISATPWSWPTRSPWPTGATLAHRCRTPSCSMARAGSPASPCQPARPQPCPAV